MSIINKNRLDWNIIIAIDGDDGTASLVSEFKKSSPYIKYQVNKNRNGKGYAIKQALIRYNNQLKDIIIIMDADNSIKFEEIVSSIKNMDNSDILIFNRYGRCNHIPYNRRFLGRTFNLMVRTILGLKINDTQSGYKIFRKKALIDDINKTSINGAFFDVSLLYHATKSGQRINEIKSKTYRHGEGSTFNTIYKIIKEEMGANVEPEYEKNPFFSYQMFTQAVIEKAKNDLSFIPEYDIRTRVRAMLGQ